jgi:hypothetical protein
MNKALTVAAFSLVALVGLAGAARAECYWAGNHWNCGDRFIYPKTFPWGTAVVNGQYQRPPSLKRRSRSPDAPARRISDWQSPR